jgi:hypothetical protein
VTEIGITGGDGYDVRITCVHRVLMLCSDTLLKGVPLLPVVSLEALLQQAGRTKDVVQVSPCEHVRLYMEHMPIIVSTRMLYHYLSAMPMSH